MIKRARQGAPGWLTSLPQWNRAGKAGNSGREGHPFLWETSGPGSHSSGSPLWMHGLMHGHYLTLPGPSDPCWGSDEHPLAGECWCMLKAGGPTMLLLPHPLLPALPAPCRQRRPLFVLQSQSLGGLWGAQSWGSACLCAGVIALTCSSHAGPQPGSAPQLPSAP